MDPLNYAQAKQKAEMLSSLRRYAQLETFLREQLVHWPRDNWFMTRLALCVFELRRVTEAFQLWSETIDIHPTSIYTLIVGAYMNYHDGEYKEVNKLAHRILEINPQSADAYDYLALVQRHWRNPGKAEAFVNKALELNPDHYYAQLRKVEILQDQNRHREVRAACLAYLEKNPGNKNFLMHLGVAQTHLRRFRAAELALASALQQNPQSRFLQRYWTQVSRYISWPAWMPLAVVASVLLVLLSPWTVLNDYAWAGAVRVTHSLFLPLSLLLHWPSLFCLPRLAELKWPTTSRPRRQIIVIGIRALYAGLMLTCLICIVQGNAAHYACWLALTYAIFNSIQQFLLRDEFSEINNLQVNCLLNSVSFLVILSLLDKEPEPEAGRVTGSLCLMCLLALFLWLKKLAYPVTGKMKPG